MDINYPLFKIKAPEGWHDATRPVLIRDDAQFAANIGFDLDPIDAPDDASNGFEAYVDMLRSSVQKSKVLTELVLHPVAVIEVKQRPARQLSYEFVPSPGAIETPAEKLCCQQIIIDLKSHALVCTLTCRKSQLDSAMTDFSAIIASLNFQKRDQSLLGLLGRKK